ncbi:hypothetical protein PSAC2689_180020 [Paraburkholderia sacchari]
MPVSAFRCVSRRCWRRFSPCWERTCAICLSPKKPTPGIDNRSRIAAMSTARKSDLIATVLGMDPFNELASRLRLTLTTWRYANALSLHRPDAFSVFAQGVCFRKGFSIPFRPHSLACLHGPSGEIALYNNRNTYLNGMPVWDISSRELDAHMRFPVRRTIRKSGG